MARILVVDDEPYVREMLRQMLTQAGYEVVEAANSEDGVKLFHQAPTDLVITDLFMPPDGGLAVIRKLRAAFPDVKIIAISGIRITEGVDVATLAKQEGALCAFSKPFGKHEMLEAVGSLLAGD